MSERWWKLRRYRGRGIGPATTGLRRGVTTNASRGACTRSMPPRVVRCGKRLVPRELLYVPGGNPAPDFAAGLRRGENLLRWDTWWRTCSTIHRIRVRAWGKSSREKWSTAKSAGSPDGFRPLCPACWQTGSWAWLRFSPRWDERSSTSSFPCSWRYRFSTLPVFSIARRTWRIFHWPQQRGWDRGGARRWVGASSRRRWEISSAAFCWLPSRYGFLLAPGTATTRKGRESQGPGVDAIGTVRVRRTGMDTGP
jgi:hypothetical protein